ncbi:rhodanese-like domain-containing protein [Altererythrobacter sp. H2]|uniref:rhodanese-like domain-containing protein n=1 Tax=Altererythrobacter sp. H2 TaxID=3108391 RepID=UPI002B4BD732|nr:rhodanese-like domain-containing protein [Altererythrobacter sp. H2]WRK96516.1 rhodanese-like domain-containing protein [Altererythrobacter sp. H2]
MRLIISVATTLAFSLSACSAERASQGADADPVAGSAVSKTNVIDVSAAEADELLAKDASLVVLDVRTPAEFAEGHIESAINIDFTDDAFAEKLARLDKSERYVLHCKSGRRSAGALKVLQKQGFENVFHMDDGFDAWKAAGNPEAQ